MTEASITVTDARVSFGRAQVLKGVSLLVPAGTCFGIVGESGSGKTTLIRAILGLQRLQSGQILLSGKPLQPGRTGARLRAMTVQAILQDSTASLSPRRRIGQLLDEVSEVLAEPKDATRARAAALFDRLGIPAAVTDKYAHQISGGQARRVCVARALLMRPRVLIADEPTAGLDVSVQGDLLNLLQEIRVEHNLTLVVVSHNLAVIRQIADQAAVMCRGEVAEVGDAAQVFDAPQSDYARSLLAAWPRLHKPANL
ncbi:ABC transporter ATP-binding protein [Cypionkella sp.]|uniref:ABC transporter ATP-binding protein n=1 Tax=Cypionkella sp. TaxID=2811411 RepID=UPI002629390F|nr:ATP-binding cassette domain-containing protein [Cypionkella sp.]MDB5665707.1 oppF 1 [Cypionkella sp.]